MNKQHQIALDFINNSPNSLLYQGIFGDDGKYFAVISYIINNKPKLILEYGGGKSTFIISKILKELNYGGKIVAFEDLKKYYDLHENQGYNLDNNIVYTPESKIDGEFFTYIHDLEPYKDVDLIIIDGPDQRVTKTNITLNLELFVNYLKKEIPYFIDGRVGSVNYYKDVKKYKSEIVDDKKEKSYELILKEYNENNI
tara:strand:- start:5029 stop:5622 length:594 start_codon:yes stop_codon:yes gene_type:complete